MSNTRTLIGDYPLFLQDILTRVVEAGFELNDFVQIDHLCYRVSSKTDYTRKKAEFTSIGTLLGENMVNGRPISTFRLHEPLRYDGWRIDTLELPAPKTGSPFKEGLEHIEFVLYDDMTTFLKKYADKPFKLQAANRGVNPEVGLQLGDYSVKFHLLSLPAVVYIENKLGMNDIRDGQ